MINIDGTMLGVELNIFFLLAVQLALAAIGGLTLYLVGAWGRPVWGKAMIACIVALSVVTCGLTIIACMEGRALALRRTDRLSLEANLQSMWLSAGLSLCVAAATVIGCRYLWRVGSRHRPEFADGSRGR
jgi:hypothetical protein